MDDAVAVEQPAAAVPDAADDGWEWAHVEIMGHREHWGRTRQEERFGTKMLRVDVPVIKRVAELEVAKGSAPDSTGPAALAIEWQTHYYTGAAIFGYRMTDEATVMKKNKPYESPYRLMHRPDPVPMIMDGTAISNRDDDDGDDDIGCDDEDKPF